MEGPLKKVERAIEHIKDLKTNSTLSWSLGVTR